MAKSVLVVDDNAAVRRSLCQVFRSVNDFEVCGEAQNGQEGVDTAVRLHPDLIVLDLSMPVMNGIEAARIIKKLMPSVPVIIFSAHSELLSESDARSAGVSALVSKSENVSVLLEKARRLLEH